MARIASEALVRGGGPGVGWRAGCSMWMRHRLRGPGVRRMTLGSVAQIRG